MASRVSNNLTKAQLVNHLRASISHGQGRTAIELVRNVGSFSQFKTFIATAYRVPNRGRHPLLPEFEKQTNKVLAYKPFDQLDLRRELEWSTLILERHETRLVQFLKESGRVQNSVLEGKDREALEILESIEDTYGVCSWTIKAKIALLHNVAGQECQKAYASDIFTDNFGLIRAIAHLSSQRNEEPVTMAGFKMRTEETIGGWDIPLAWTTYLRYALLGKVPNTDTDICAVLTTAAGGTCIDLLIAVIDIIDHNQELTIRENNSAVSRVQRILSNSSLKGAGDFVGLLNAARKANPSAGDDSVVHRTSCLLAEVIRRSDDAEESYSQIEKLSLNFGFLPIYQLFGRFLKTEIAVDFPVHHALIQSASFRLGSQLKGVWIDSKDSKNTEQLVTALEVAWGDYNDPAIRSACAVLEEGDPYDRVTSARSLFGLELRNGAWLKAASIALACIIEFPGSRFEFPLSETLRNKTWADLRNAKDTCAIALTVCYAIDELPPGPEAQRFHRHLQQLALKLLRDSRRANFSDLFEGSLDSIMLRFLSDVCTQSVMEVNIKLSSSRELSTERMKICQKLVQRDALNANKYLDEIRQITYAHELEEGVRNFDSSRLFVNESGLKDWGTKAIAEEYARYKLLRDASLPDLTDIQNALLTLRVDRDSPVPQALLEKPKTEADRLLVELIQKVLREYMFSSSYGLNSYLSLRVRHGSMAGHLRGPFEEAGAIALRDSVHGVYQPIAAWEATCANLALPLADEFNQAFDAFSQKFDERVHLIVDDLIQIRSDVKPRGLFDIQVSPFLVNVLKTATQDDLEPGDFVKTCISHFKATLEPALERIRSEITKLKDHVDDEIDLLLERLTKIQMHAQMAPVLDAVKRGRTNFSVAADRVCDWFMALNHADHERRYTLEQIIRIGERLTANARPSFEPALKIQLRGDIPEFTPQFGAFLIADAIFIVLDNAHLHSLVEGAIEIDVDVELLNENVLVFDIRNKIGDDANNETSLARIESIRNHLDSGEFRKMVANEGGTGLFKLARLVEHIDKNSERAISFGFEPDGFRTKFSIPVSSIEVDDLN